MQQRKKQKNRGFTLTELLVAVAVLVIVITPLTVALIKNGKFLTKNKEKLVAESIASEQIEIIKNLAYDDVGTDTGWPHGGIAAHPDPITRSGISFQKIVSIVYVDDPYDMLAPTEGGVTCNPAINDCYSNDYKKVEVSVAPASNPLAKTILTTDISPSGQETASNTGILEIRVINASGDPVPAADINVVNTNQGINIITQTQIDGKISIPVLPPDTDNYHIEATKTGCSLAQTYPASVDNPNPDPQDQSVLLLQLTSLTLSIDLLSSMTINTVDTNGAPIIDPVTFNLHGEKKIGSNDLGDPIYKYTSTQTTSGGSINFTSMEWDSYTFELDAASATRYKIMDMTLQPPEPTTSISVSLPPGSNSSFNITLAPI